MRYILLGAAVLIPSIAVAILEGFVANGHSSVNVELFGEFTDDAAWAETNEHERTRRQRFRCQLQQVKRAVWVGDMTLVQGAEIVIAAAQAGNASLLRALETSHPPGLPLREHVTILLLRHLHLLEVSNECPELSRLRLEALVLELSEWRELRPETLTAAREIAANLLHDAMRMPLLPEEGLDPLPR